MDKNDVSAHPLNRQRAERVRVPTLQQKIITFIPLMVQVHGRLIETFRSTLRKTFSPLAPGCPKSRWLTSHTLQNFKGKHASKNECYAGHDYIVEAPCNTISCCLQVVSRCRSIFLNGCCQLISILLCFSPN